MIITAKEKQTNYVLVFRPVFTDITPTRKRIV